MLKKKVLVTGCAGFIGFHAAKSLLTAGHTVIGIDNLNAYYEVKLKLARLEILQKFPNFGFYPIDLHAHNLVIDLAKKHQDLQFILHLAAQAGVRYSLTNPFAYLDSNITGQVAILELAKKLPALQHLVYASSSSVYGANQKLPFAVEDRVDQPISLYAATKRSCELFSSCYSHLFKLRITGLRFFTVYGPWGRPDMAAFIFTKAILAGEKIPVYNYGDMRRNFTFIEDIITGVIACLFKDCSEQKLHKVYNLGNDRSEKLLDFISVLETQLGIKAELDLQPLQPGDVKETLADLTAAQRDFGFVPRTNIQEGLKHFIAWYKDYYGT